MPLLNKNSTFLEPVTPKISNKFYYLRTISYQILTSIIAEPVLKLYLNSKDNTNETNIGSRGQQTDT